MENNLLQKASILLTPTAYNDGRMLSVKPNENLYGSELVTNGDFATDSDWTKQTGWSISGGSANYDFATNSKYIRQTLLNGGFVSGKNYQVNFEITSGVAYLNVKSNAETLESTASYSIGSHSIYVTASANGSDLLIYGVNTQGSAFSIDNISVKEDLSGDFTFSRGSAATRVNAQGLVENVQIISDELVSNGNFSQEGSELIANGGFDTDSDWSLGTGWSIGDGKLIGANADASTYQGVGIQANKSYKIEFTVVDYVSGSVRPLLNGAPNVDGANVSANGIYTQYLTSTSGSNGNFTVRGVSFIGSISNVSVKEVGQDWSLVGGSTTTDALNIISTDGSLSSGKQLNVLEIGKKYKYSFDITSYTSGNLFFNEGSTSVLSGLNATGTYTGQFISTGTSIEFKRGGVSNASISNISVKEITDDTDLPRIDYTDGCGSWLLEPQSTNLITYSSDLSSLNLRSNVVVTGNEVISPSGNLDADKITFDGTLYGRVEQTIPATVGQPYTISVYLKNKDLSDVTQVWIGFSQVGQGQFITITDEWQRYDITTSADGTSEYPRIQFSGTGSLYAWGFQVEQQSYATSYIPTNGSIATRLADEATNSGNSTLINSTEGVLYVECKSLPLSSTKRIAVISDGSKTNRISLAYVNGSDLRADIRINNSQSNLVGGGELESDFSKIAVRWSFNTNTFSLWKNGLEISNGTFTGGFTSNLSEIQFADGDNQSNFYGKAKALAVYKEALTDEQLQSLTTI